jgi:hypothetical protein
MGHTDLLLRIEMTQLISRPALGKWFSGMELITVITEIVACRDFSRPLHGLHLF